MYRVQFNNRLNKLPFSLVHSTVVTHARKAKQLIYTLRILKTKKKEFSFKFAFVET